MTEGIVTAVNGNMVSVRSSGTVTMNEVAYIESGERSLKSEVIRIRGDSVQVQVYEITKGIKVGNRVRFTDELLSVELGPGLLGQIFDGLQNPLPEIAGKVGYFLEPGLYLKALPRDTKWHFSPLAQAGDPLRRGDPLGWVPELHFKHQIMLPFDFYGDWKLSRIADEGDYTLDDTIAEVVDSKGTARPVHMWFSWPVKRAVDCYVERLKPATPLVTQTRIIDTFFPVAKGGTYCIPGPFGAGKTVLQQVTSRHADVDIVLIAACGERAGEVVETLK